MSDAEKPKDALGDHIIFVEELTTKDTDTYALECFATTRTVRDIKKAIAGKLGDDEQWEGIEVYFTGKPLETR